MEASPVSPANGFRGRGGRGGRGSPFGGRGSPFRGRGGGGPGRGSPFRGRGAGSPFRGGSRGGSRGGRGSFRGGDNGSAPFRGGRGSFRGGDNGPAPFRGGRGAFRGGRGRGGSTGERLDVSSEYLELYNRNGLDSNYIKFPNLIEVTNLPTLLVQDISSLRPFIVEKTGVSIRKVCFRLPSEKSGSVTAVCEIFDGNCVDECADKLHGQVFNGRHLLVNRNFGASPAQLEDCVKVSTIKPVPDVTEETLYNLFESCGKLGVIRLTNYKPDAALQAVITFEDSDSVLNALKLNGSKLGKTKIHVENLGRLFVNISPAAAVESVLKDFKIIHIDKVSDGSAYVYFKDEDSQSNALKLNGTTWEGEGQIVIKTPYSLFLGDPDLKLTSQQLQAVFGSAQIFAHPRRRDIHVIRFDSKTGAESALKASPVLISNNSYNVVDSPSKIPIVVKSEVKVQDQEEDQEEEEEEDDDEEVEGEEEVDDEEEEEEVDDEEDDEEEEVDDEEEVDEEEDDDGEQEEDDNDEEEEEEDESEEEEVAAVVPKPSNGKKALQKPPAQTLKRKMNNVPQKAGSKKRKA